MNKMSRFLIISILLFLLTSLGGIAYAGGTVTKLSASYNNSTGILNISGTGSGVEKDIVVIEVLKPNGDLLYFGTASLDSGGFESSITVGSLPSGIYKVRCADYDGGAYKVASFTIGTTPPSGGDSGTGGGGSIPSTTSETSRDTTQPATPQVETKTEVKMVENKVVGIVSILGKADDNGRVLASVTTLDMSKTISESLKNAKEIKLDKVDLQISVGANEQSKSIELVLPKEALNNMENGHVNSLTINTPVGNISFDKKSLYGIESSGDLSIQIGYADSNLLSAKAKTIIGDRTAFEFSIKTGEKEISKFDGTLTITVPYTPKYGEDLDSIVVYYINPKGIPEIMSNCLYNEATGHLTFKTNHFSTYAVGYNKKTFVDVEKNSWYHRAVNFIAARDITFGTGNNKFSPMEKLSRAEFLVMLLRTYGIQPDTNPIENFADGGNTYYTGYLSTAKRLNISQGTGDNLFLPDKKISRQEMFVLLYNTLKTMEELPTEVTGAKLEDFADNNLIDNWAVEAIRTLVEKGFVSGSNGKINPLSSSTRAEMAQLLYNILNK